MQNNSFMSRIYEFIHVHVVLLCDSTLPLNFSFSICSFINYNYIHGFISTSNYLFICRRCLLILCFCVIHLTLTAAKTSLCIFGIYMPSGAVTSYKIVYSLNGGLRLLLLLFSQIHSLSQFIQSMITVEQHSRFVYSLNYQTIAYSLYPSFTMYIYVMSILP